MSTRTIAFVPGEYYHIYNRGNSRQNIFRTTHDYNRFESLLFLSNSVHSFNIKNIGSKNLFDVDREKQLVNILAYCLMPNHFHILLTPLEDVGVSSFMLKLGTAYSMFFNKKYNRTGSLFEGVFKSQHVVQDVHFQYLFAYIHMNPLKLIDRDWKKNGLKDKDATFKYLRSYNHSSLSDYLSESVPKREESKILDKDLFGELFNREKVVLDELNDWLIQPLEQFL
jgi:putative transposase